MIIKSYTRGGDAKINNLIRANPNELNTSSITVHGKTGYFGLPVEGSEITFKLKRLQQLLNDAPDPPPPQLVWRGIQDASVQTKKSLNMGKYKEGDVFELTGFQSSSLDPSTARSFSGKGIGGEGGTILEIAPKKGAYLEPITAYKGEREFLIPANSKFRVIGRKKVKGQFSFEKPLLEGEYMDVLQVEML
jgi:hypothetical protein